MTTEEIAIHYPDCQQAVALHEERITPLVWMALRSVAETKGIDGTLQMVQEIIRDRHATKLLLAKYRNLPEEMATPGFRRYLQAKLGAM